MKKVMILVVIVWMTMTAAVGQTALNIGFTIKGNAAFSIEGMGTGLKGGLGVFLPHKTDATFTVFGNVGYGFPVVRREFITIRPNAFVAAKFNSPEKCQLGMELLAQFRAPWEYPAWKHIGGFVGVSWGVPVVDEQGLKFDLPNAGIIWRLGASIIL